MKCHSMPIAATFLCAIAPLAIAGGRDQITLLPKQIAAPPSDILDGTVRLPTADQVAIESVMARMPVEVMAGADGSAEWSAMIPIDDGSNVRVLLLQPEGSRYTLDVIPPASGPGGFSLQPSVIHGEIEGFARTPAAEMRTFPVARAGEWTVRVRAPRMPAATEAWVFIATDSPHALRSTVQSVRHVPGAEAVITADLRTDARPNESAMLTSVVAHIGDQTFEMFDDGLHTDGAAGDGVYGITIPLERVGQVEVRIEAEGVTDVGNRFVRTVDHRIEVAPGGVALAPANAVADLSADPGAAGSQLRIDIPVVADDPHRRVVVAAELWGQSPATGEAIPAVWGAMVTEPRERVDGSAVISLYIDRGWLATGVVNGPFELRNMRAHDIDSFVPVALVERAVPVRTIGELDLPDGAPRAVTPAMRIGRPRADLALALTLPEEEMSAAMAESRAVGAHNLMLSHGYCAGGSPWPSAHFTGFKEVFSDPDQNRTHDQFAQLLLVFGFNSKSYGIVGHSQGGCASLHLWNFYFSGLDWAEGPRLIQSVGTPYQGTPLASLGGFSCGVNNDLTPAGAATWLSTIPNASRSAVYYYTTSFTSSWCDFFANILLSSPNDGVVEVSRGQLPGANSMGNTTGWCHTTGMSYPAQYTDSSRNAILNTNAAR